jgi:predicted DNA-binding antitoxin AbrB/MazE fold protein
MSVRAIYENGVFRPASPVNLPERAEVELEILAPSSTESKSAKNSPPPLDQILSRRYRTGQTDSAARHDEHQP